MSLEMETLRNELGRVFGAKHHMSEPSCLGESLQCIMKDEQLALGTKTWCAFHTEQINESVKWASW